ncbi:MAG: vWA domain-containing protein [Phycisphaerae bacterium]
MDFLSPLNMAIAGALTVPPLVALYFLKLKRQVKPVPSTLLWKRAVEDLHVNSPFQKLRRSILLLLQLLVLLAAAFALGQPMFEMAETHRDTVILLVDQSASMDVMEESGKTRLAIAKEEATAFVDNMADGARAMVIAFCDRATVVSAFDTDKDALKRKIAGIEQTQSTSGLTEAITLAEAYSQNIIIGMQGQKDIEMTTDSAPASVALFTDGRIEDADQVVLQRFDLNRVKVYQIGNRSDNVGIVAMDARRNYDRPEFLEVSATISNFGDASREVDAVLYVAGQNVDIQTIQVGPFVDDVPSGSEVKAASGENSGSQLRSSATVVFDAIEYDGEGLVEISLRVEDALDADNRAWTMIDEPRALSILLVTAFNPLLQGALDVLEVGYKTMTPDEYEAASEDELMDGDRSLFDVVIIDGHSTERLPTGNYFFWGGVPQLEGVKIGEPIRNQVLFNWDDAHPVLRYTSVEKIVVNEWFDMQLPAAAELLIEGETSPVLAFLNDGASRYLVSAFSLIRYDEVGPLYNSNLAKIADFLPFMQNSLRFLSGVMSVGGQRTVRPGEPITMPVPTDVQRIKLERPDKRTDDMATAGYPTLQYADTRMVGPYRLDPGLAGQDRFAVNLFSDVESHVKPADSVRFGGEVKSAQATSVKVSEPAWPYLLLAMLFFLLLEWAVYNRKVFV